MLLPSPGHTLAARLRLLKWQELSTGPSSSLFLLHPDQKARSTSAVPVKQFEMPTSASKVAGTVEVRTTCVGYIRVELCVALLGTVVKLTQQPGVTERIHARVNAAAASESSQKLTLEWLASVLHRGIQPASSTSSLFSRRQDKPVKRYSLQSLREELKACIESNDIIWPRPAPLVKDSAAGMQDHTSISGRALYCLGRRAEVEKALEIYTWLGAGGTLMLGSGLKAGGGDKSLVTIEGDGWDDELEWTQAQKQLSMVCEKCPVVSMYYSPVEAKLLKEISASMRFDLVSFDPSGLHHDSVLDDTLLKMEPTYFVIQNTNFMNVLECKNCPGIKHGDTLYVPGPSLVMRKKLLAMTDLYEEVIFADSELKNTPNRAFSVFAHKAALL